MSRRKRPLRKKFIIFCEGDTEYNYIDAMRVNQGVELALKPINMRGGGYSNFLDVIRTESNSNCLAKFIIIDLDRLHKHQGEKQNLIDLIKYCDLQNKNGRIPHFLIVDNPDFEYLACLHITEYNGQEVVRYIQRQLGFDLDEFKAKKDIYNYLNSHGNSYENMLSRLFAEREFVSNKYKIKKESMEILIKQTLVYWEQESSKGSNIHELFEILDW